MQWIIKEIKKRKKMRDFFSFIIQNIRKKQMFLYNKILGVKRNKIVFTSFFGQSYSDNPKAISEKLYQISLTYDIVWLFNDPDKKREIVPGYVRLVKAESFKSYRELATAKFWVDNCMKAKYIYKSEEQIYIQTWHGDRGFKKIANDIEMRLSPGTSSQKELLDPRIWNLALAGSQFANKVIETAFGYHGETYTNGLPRNDQLIAKDTFRAGKIKRSLGINPNSQILMYAPTFRDSSRKKRHGFDGIDFREIIQHLERKTENTWICLVRAHGEEAGFEKIQDSDHKIIDVSAYEDMSDLLLISDFLITDYSSCAGDFALLRRPIVLYQHDRSKYKQEERDFYFDIDMSPYVVTKSYDELIRAIKEYDMDFACQNCEDILEFYGTQETGKSSELVVNYIISHSK